MLLDQIADYCRQEAGREPPQVAVHHAKRAVIDWFAALYPGTRMPPATNLVRAHREELGRGKSSLPGFGDKAFPALAAWINGTSAHAAEFDDIFRPALYHPGAPTIAAALAMGEDANLPGRDFLKAVIVGYEVSTRIGVAIQPSHYRFFHTTGTVGCLGSAAACAFLLAPGDGDVMRHSLATAASIAAGLQQAFRSDSMTKALHSGHAASAGLTAAKAAAAGATGAMDILEGEAGFGAALSSGADWERATEGLGERYNITSITQKAHGCCGHAFAAIDAALALRPQLAAHDTIQSITVDTYKAALDIAGHLDPQSPTQARFSIPYVVCVALIHGSVRLDAFTDASLQDARLRALMKKLILNHDPA